jgi:Uma2 family endonuclease
MSTKTEPRPIVYPDSDGQPMAENTLQFETIVTIQGGLDALFRDDPDVFVAGDLLWYPVEGRPDIRTAPDALVAFGRPKGHRGSYQQWLEGAVAPQVVFEVLSPGNRFPEMMRKFRFYEQYGVEGYYVYDPDRGELAGWTRTPGGLQDVPDMAGHVSARLAVRFELEGGALRLYGPDGRRFCSYAELVREREDSERLAGQERARADLERARADEARETATRERETATRERQRADRERDRAERLAARLKALGAGPEE